MQPPHDRSPCPTLVFKPYASIGTNLLFFEKGETTRDIWFIRAPRTGGARRPIP